MIMTNITWVLIPCQPTVAYELHRIPPSNMCFKSMSCNPRDQMPFLLVPLSSIITRASWSPPSPYWGTATVVGSAPAQNGARKTWKIHENPITIPESTIQKWASTPRSTSGTWPGGAWGLKMDFKAWPTSIQQLIPFMEVWETQLGSQLS